MIFSVNNDVNVCVSKQIVYSFINYNVDSRIKGPPGETERKRYIFHIEGTLNLLKMAHCAFKEHSVLEMRPARAQILFKTSGSGRARIQKFILFFVK